MKTDKEFLEGIYRKAEQLLQEENESKDNKASKRKISWSQYQWKQAKVVFVLCLLALIILPISRYELFWNTKNKKEAEKEATLQRIGVAEENITSDKNNIDENAELSIDSAAYSLEVDSDKGKSISSSNFYLVSGMVTKIKTIEENQVEVTIQILHTYQGTAKSEITFLCLKESLWFDIAKEEKELLFYLTETDGVYKLSSGDYSLYRILKEENNEKIYETKDGSTISSDIIQQSGQ